MVVSLNMSATSQTIRVDLAAVGLAGRRLVTLLSSPRPIPETDVGKPLTLAPYAAWVAHVRAQPLHRHAPRRTSPRR
jgi:alpha-glucosidase